jgi:outer membrane protein assembly factor BamB
MSEHDDFYRPEHIDEQVDALLRARNMPDQDLRMAQDLRIALTNADADTDAHSLQRVLHRLQEGQHSQHQQSAEIAPSLEWMQHKKHGRLIRMKTTHAPINKMRPVTRVFATLAATLIVAVLIGSMLILSHMARSGGSTVTGSANTTKHPQVQASLPKGVYTSSATTVFRLSGQTHQRVIWQQAVLNAIKIIPAGNVVYILQNNSQSKTYAALELDASTGKILWTHSFAAQTQASPDGQITDMVFAQNHLYVSWAAAADTSQQGRSKIYILNALSGGLLSVYTNLLVEPIDASYGIHTMDANDGVFAVGARGVQVYSVTTGKFLWHASMVQGGLSANVSMLKIVNNLVYVIFTNNNDAVGNGKSYVVAYQATTGQQVWQSPFFPGDALYRFAVDQNIVYFGTLNIISPNQPFAGRVYAYNIQSNKQLWSTAVDGGAQEPFVVSNGVVYTAADPGRTANSHLIALDAATGAIKWHQTLNTYLLDSFCVSNGVVYTSRHFVRPDTGALNANADIEAFSAGAGQKLWESGQYGSTNIVPTA